MSHDRKAAKAKELKTRKRLGPRTPKPEYVPHAVTAPPKVPRATGAPGAALRSDHESGNRGAEQ